MSGKKPEQKISDHGGVGIGFGFTAIELMAGSARVALSTLSFELAGVYISEGE